MSQDEKSRWHLKSMQRLIGLVTGLVLVSLACNLPTSLSLNNPRKPAGYVETGVAGTLLVIESNLLPEGTASVSDGTQTPEDPSSPTQTPTDSLTTTEDVTVFLSENTNCRIGQGTSFERVTVVLKGEEAPVVGVDTSESYWYIRRPDKLTELCWLWAKYATPAGPDESLPVFTPVPTPTPGFEFDITYHSNIGLCGGFYVLQYRIVNTGSVTLESWSTSSTDHTGGSNPATNQQDKFFDRTGCAPDSGLVNLTPGQTYFVNAMYNNDPVGHDITVSVQICTVDGLAGNCQTRTIRHTP
jgi:hypothetical protein